MRLVPLVEDVRVSEKCYLLLFIMNASLQALLLRLCTLVVTKMHLIDDGINAGRIDFCLPKLRDRLGELARHHLLVLAGALKVRGWKRLGNAPFTLPCQI